VADILETILAAKAVELAQAQAVKPLAALQAEVARARDDNAPRDFFGALQTRIVRKQAAVIAEIKKASPSQGVIRAEFDVEAIARTYAENGAACLSVLTDQQFFQGRSEYLAMARRASGLPALRKDFIIDVYQVWEARALGADCILLIAAALADEQLQAFSALATELGMAALVEVHDHGELARAARAGVRLLGINNRNLRTFQIRLETTLDMLAEVPQGVLVVTESGIRTHDDVARMQNAGVNAFLVGESLMRAQDPGKELKLLFSFN
jgi:indole-3-glycerol phosphate synthase